MRLTRSRWLLAIGLTVLLLGTLLYILDRPPDQTSMLSGLSLFQHTPAVFGSLGHSFPTFAHVFAFCLLTAGLLGDTKKNAVLICLGWFYLDAAFELGQTQPVAESLRPFIPQWLEYLPILQQTKSYFVNGTFDVFDLISIAVGAVTAYFVIRWSSLEEKSYA